MENGKKARYNILIADDSEMNRALLSEILSDDYDITEVENGQQAVNVLLERAQDFAIVLLDIVMPVMDGFGVLSVMSQHQLIEDVPVIMISAESSPSSIDRAYDYGVADYISRPFDPAVVRRRVNNTILLYAKQRRLADMVAEQIHEKERNMRVMISILSHIVEFRNSESGLHVTHIRALTELLLRSLAARTDAYRLTPEEIQQIGLASALHDIGKISIPDEILNKPGRFTPEEFEIMKGHSAAGAEMLQTLPFYQNTPLVHTAYEICRWHHERYDGRGYPDGLKGDEIPISAQVVALADVYDALTSERCYKKAFTHEQAIQMILNGECGAFNPLVLECLHDVEPMIPQALRDSEAPEDASAAPALQERLDVIARLHDPEMIEEPLPPEGSPETGLSLTRGQARSLMEYIRPLFDTVRLVDTDAMTQLSVNDANEIVHEPATCYCDWGRNARCDNCIAEKVISGKRRAAKFEFFNDEMYHVNAIYVELEGRPCSLEMVSQVDDEMLTGDHDQDELVKSISNYNSKVYTDSMTGVYNRRYFDEQLAQLKDVDAVMYLDVNNFKQVNDTYGHQTGDLVLIAVSNAISSCLRSTDPVVRYGGDEFCVVFRRMPREMFELKMALMRERLSHVTLKDYPKLTFSASLGGAYGPGSTTDLVRIADERMYKEKMVRAALQKA